jgi:hypothetical protein
MAKLKKNQILIGVTPINATWNPPPLSPLKSDKELFTITDNNDSSHTTETFSPNKPRE